nr:ComEC/Rec2 family competence protein [Effusibacillus pohliae]
MRRILLQLTVFFLAGIAIACFSPVYRHSLLIGLIVCLLLAITAALLVRRQRGRIFPPLLLAVLFAAVGFLYSQAYSAFHSNQLQPYYDQPVTVIGVIEETPVVLNGKRQYTVRVERLQPEHGQPVWLQDRIRVTDSRKNGPDPVYGDRVELRGVLLEPASPRNPGGFDDKRYLERQGIHGRLSVKNRGDLLKIGTLSNLYGLTIVPLQEHLWNVLHRLFPPGEAELAGGLVIGFRADLPVEWESAFQRLSVTHILAASGMNVGLIAGTLFALMRRLRLSKRIANPVVIGTIFLYALLAGAGPSVVRAGLMATLVVVGASLGRKADILTSLATAALLSALWNPGIVSDIGFLLSFVTTIGLLLLTPRLTRVLRGPAWLRPALAVTLAAQIASTPLLLYYFNELSPFSLVANLYIMPLTCLLVPLGFGLLALGAIHPWLALPFLGFYRCLMWLLVKPVVWLADATADWTLIFPSPPVWAVWLLYGGLLALLFRKQIGSSLLRYANPGWLIGRPPCGWKIGRLLAGGPVTAGLILTAFWLWPSSELRVTFLDVGQGDSALIETPKGLTILVDGGGIPSHVQSDFDVGEKIVMPFLRYRGIRAIDYMVATHADEDHVRGLLAVVEQLQVRNLIVSGYEDPGAAYQQLLQAARWKGIPIYRSQAGIGWQPEPGVTWRFLHPGSIHTGTRSDTNANCVVFELQYGERKFLFTGDVEGEVESDFLPDLEPVDVLKVAHHGSQHSTGEAFLQRVHPRYAIISVGRHNVYRQPHKQLLERLSQAGAVILRTDRNGAITVITDGKHLQVQPAIAAEPISPPD